MRNVSVLLLFIYLIVAWPANVFAGQDDNLKSIKKWNNLLNSGDTKERKLALDNLWMLHYYNYSKNADFYKPALNAVKDIDPLVREAAISLFRGIGDNSDNKNGFFKNTPVVPALIEALKDNEPRVRSAAAEALAYAKDNRAVNPLIVGLQDNDPWVRLNAAFALGELKDSTAILPLLALLEDDTDWRYKFAQQEAIKALRKMGAYGSNIENALFRKAEDKYLRAEIVKTLGQSRISAMETKLRHDHVLESKQYETKPSGDNAMLLAKDDNPTNRRLAAEKLGTSDGGDTIQVLITLLEDNNEYVRQAAARSLGERKAADAVPALIKALNDHDNKVKEYAVWALGETNDPGIVDPLLVLLTDENTKIIERSLDALRKQKSQDINRKVVIHLLRLSKPRSATSHARYTLQRLIKLDGDKTLFDALRDPDGDETKTLENNISIYEDGIYYISDNLIKNWLIAYKDRALLISVLAIFIDKQNETPYNSIRLLGEFKDKRALPVLYNMLNSKNTFRRDAIIDAISMLGGTEAADKYISILSDTSEIVSSRCSAARALGELKDKRAVSTLINIMNDAGQEDTLRTVSAAALGDLGDTTAVVPLINILNNKHVYKWTRIAAINSLVKLGDKRALEAIRNASREWDSHVSGAAELALTKLQ